MEKLRLLPFTELKVDRAFVFGAATDSAAQSILNLSVEIGKSLDMTVIAEGVETQEEWDLVSATGCDQVQGYFIAKPMPAEQFINWKIDWEDREKVNLLKP